MIKDKGKLAAIQSSWETVRIFEAKVKTSSMASMSNVFGVPVSYTFWDFPYSLVLLFAFSVLQDTLQQLQDEQKFNSQAKRSKKDTLGSLMKNSQGVINWVNFKLIEKGRLARNAIAHERQTLERIEVWKYIDAIEEELIAWGIIQGKVVAEYTITREAFRNPHDAEPK